MYDTIRDAWLELATALEAFEISNTTNPSDKEGRDD
jgi:hypothetical protein